jgi:predicted ATP-dependent serine protease
MSEFKKLSEIPPETTPRNMTGFMYLDQLYGKNDLPYGNIGMPNGKISLWAGESGVGKSRLCIEVAKWYSTHYSDGKVLYFLTEAPLSDFASWAKDTTQYDNIYCSGEDRIDEIIKIIYEVKPKLVFIDSVNEIEEFENGNKKEARRLIKGVKGINGKPDKPGLKQVTHDVGCHTILLGQINQDGKTIKGGTSLPHLVDIALNVVKTEDMGIFEVKVGIKHRHGDGKVVATFKHTNDGVESYFPMDDRRPIGAPIRRELTLNDINKLTLNEIDDITLQHRDTLTPNELKYLQDRHYLITKANMVASGEIRVDANNRIIPGSNKPDASGLLDRLNRGIGDFFGLK